MMVLWKKMSTKIDVKNILLGNAAVNVQPVSKSQITRLTCLFITSFDRPFGYPIMCTDIYSQCYFVH